MRALIFGAAAVLLTALADVAAVESQTRSSIQAAQDALPQDFRGRITYRGTHEGAQQRGRRGTREFGGALTIELTFDGNAVTGTFSGTGGINNGTMSGSRNGTRCRLFEARGGDIMEGECTRTRFSVEVRSQGNRNAIAAHFDAQATQLVDAADEDRQREASRLAEAEQGRVRRAQADQAQRAEADRIAARPPATSAQARLLTTAIEQDSQGWLANRYDAGSIRNIRVASDSGSTTLRGEYTYNGGNRGWVVARVSAGRVTCLEFHDTYGQCSAVRDRAQQASARGTGTASSRSSAGRPPGSAAGRQDMNRSNMVNMSRCFRIHEAPVSQNTERVRRENGANFWYETVVTSVSGGDLIYNTCSSSRRLEVTTNIGTSSVITIDPQSGTTYSDTWTYRDLTDPN